MRGLPLGRESHWGLPGTHSGPSTDRQKPPINGVPRDTAHPQKGGAKYKDHPSGPRGEVTPVQAGFPDVRIGGPGWAAHCSAALCADPRCETPRPPQEL